MVVDPIVRGRLDDEGDLDIGPGGNSGPGGQGAEGDTGSSGSCGTGSDIESADGGRSTGDVEREAIRGDRGNIEPARLCRDGWNARWGGLGQDDRLKLRVERREGGGELRDSQSREQQDSNPQNDPYADQRPRPSGSSTQGRRGSVRSSKRRRSGAGRWHRSPGHWE